MKQAIILIPLIGWILLAGCKSNQGEITDNKNKADSVVADLNLKENKIGVFEPPDSTYTGDYFEKYQSGVIKVRGGFQIGEKSGKWMYFFADGKLWSEAYFHKGKMNGESNVYYPNGKLMYNGYYKMDVADSVWMFYDSTGKIADKRDYRLKNNAKK